MQIPPVPLFEEVQNVIRITAHPADNRYTAVPKFEGEVQDEVQESPQVPEFKEVQVPPTVETQPEYDRADSQLISCY